MVPTLPNTSTFYIHAIKLRKNIVSKPLRTSPNTSKSDRPPPRRFIRCKSSISWICRNKTVESFNIIETYKTVQTIELRNSKSKWRYESGGAHRCTMRRFSQSHAINNWADERPCILLATPIVN